MKNGESAFVCGLLMQLLFPSLVILIIGKNMNLNFIPAGIRVASGKDLSRISNQGKLTNIISLDLPAEKCLKAIRLPIFGNDGQILHPLHGICSTNGNTMNGCKTEVK